MASVIPVVYWKFWKLPRGERHLYFNADGFVADTMNRALRASWAVTFFVLAFSEQFLDENYFEDLPGSFYLQVALATMLSVWSCTFFFLNRSTGDDGAGQDFDA